jgi:hypothetical protein
MTRASVSLVAAALLAACSATPGARDEPALIRYYSQDATITVPDTAMAGVPFEVVVRTFGGGCTREAASDNVRYSPGVVVQLYNHNAGGSVCTSDLLRIEHRVTLRLDTRGTYSINIKGVNRGTETNDATVAWVIQRTVTVR